MNIKEEILWKGEKAIKVAFHAGNTGIYYVYLSCFKEGHDKYHVRAVIPSLNLEANTVIQNTGIPINMRPDYYDIIDSVHKQTIAKVIEDAKGYINA